jgi:hypothetical protein
MALAEVADRSEVRRIERVEAPFRFLEIPPDSDWSSLLGECYRERSCILVACRFKRLCVSETWVDRDPIYRDSEREHTTYSKRNFAVGWVNPTDFENVKQALRTLIRLNTLPPFNPEAPE